MIHAYGSMTDSRLPDESTPRTMKTCVPGSRPLTVYGDVQAAKSAPSSEHSNVTPLGSGTATSNVNVAKVSNVLSLGPVRISVSGPVTSMKLHVRVAGVGSTLPATSIARTASVWSPGSSSPFGPSSSNV